MVRLGGQEVALQPFHGTESGLLLVRGHLADRDPFEVVPDAFDLPPEDKASWGRFDPGGAAVVRVPDAADVAGAFEPLHGPGHAGRVGVELGGEVGLPLRTGLPQAHHQQFLPGVQAHLAEQLTGEHAMSLGEPEDGVADRTPGGDTVPA